jgi:hypothetical protein
MPGNTRKKTILLIFFFTVFSSVFFTENVFAQRRGYQLLAPIPTVEQPLDGTAISFPAYLKGLIVAIVGLSIIFAVIMIVIGGIEYVTAIVPSAKSEGKKKIIGAISGLLIAIFSYLLLITINPELVRVGLDLDTVPASIYPPYVGGPGNPGTGHVGDPGVGGIGGGVATGDGTCTPMTTGKCRVDNLIPTFGQYAEKMSAICNVESRGKVGAESGSDLCQHTGPPFSFGLFQVNLTVHDLGGLDCMYQHDPNIRALTARNYACTVGNQDMYDRCVAAAKNPEINISYAKVLLNSRLGFNHWGANSICHFTK